MSPHLRLLRHLGIRPSILISRPTAFIQHISGPRILLQRLPSLPTKRISGFHSSGAVPDDACYPLAAQALIPAHDTGL